MSSSGKARALLEARRREEIRKENVRNKCRSIIAAIESNINQMNSGELQEVQNEISEIRNEIEDSVNILTSKPDKALENIESVLSKVSHIVNQSALLNEKWSELQENWQQKLTEIKMYAESLKLSKFKIANKSYEEISDRISLIEIKGYKDDMQELNEIETKIDNIYIEIENEEVRRDIIKSLMKTFKDLGFSSGKPKLNNNTVSLMGTLPSGKKASFLINQDGTFDFDFEGYSGTACKDTLDEIKLTLKKSSGVETEITQFEWHNPDLKYKDAQTFPEDKVRRA